MDVYTDIPYLRDKHEKITVALGTFDGVHIGHQSVIRRAVVLAAANEGLSAVVTFANHPLTVVTNRPCPPLIADDAAKQAAIAALGVDVLIDMVFTPELLKMSPEKFIELLVERLAPRNIVVGPNFTFGYRGAGDVEQLCQWSSRWRYAAHVEPAVKFGSTMVSSTRVRELIADGAMRDAAALLGKPFTIAGVVVHGDKRGRALGFPTANIDIAPQLATPPNGVYATYVRVKKSRWPAVANVGVNPTFNGEKKHIEIYILEFAAELYGEKLELEFIEYLRPERRFSDSEALTVQISNDVKTARRILLALKNS